MKRSFSVTAGVRRLAISVSLLAILLAGAAVSFAQRTEYRGFWVDTFNTAIDNEAQVIDIVTKARQAKSNAIFVQIRRRGDSWYLNSLEPRGDRRTFTPANFDPLQSLIDHAHSSDPTLHMEVHAFVIVGAVWNRDPRCANLQPPIGHVFLSNGAFDPVTKNIDPESDSNWLTRTLLPDSGPHATTCQTATPNIGFNGQRFGAEFWIDLGHPDASQYTHNVLMHLVRNYDIDGVHLDRIRYPEFTASGQTAANGTNIGYNKTSVRRFNEHYGRTGNPATGDPLWMQWRRDQVSNFVRRLYLDIAHEKPNVKVSGAFIAFGGIGSNDTAWNLSEAYWRVYQDWRAWTEEGIVDIAIPMNYKREHMASNVPLFDQWNEFVKNHSYNRSAMLGTAVYLNSIEGSLVQTRKVFAPSALGNNVIGVNFYSFATTNVAVPGNPFSIPAGTNTPARPFAEFAAALTTGRSVNGSVLYEDPAVNPTPIFADRAAIPVLSWKVAPTKGHIRGFAKRSDNTPLDTAALTIEKIDSGSVRTGSTDGNGFYGGVDLEPGQYFVKAELGNEQLTSCLVNVAAGTVTTADLAVENTAPVTVASVIPAAPNGSNGWYVSDVELTLAATDSCSGVRRSEYSIDGGVTWQTAVNGTATISDEGIITVQFRSVDRAGNVEAAGSRVLMIDKTGPAATLTADPSAIWPPNGRTVNVALSGTAEDAASGLASVTYAVTDEYGTDLDIPARTLTGTSADWAEILAVEATRRGGDRNGRLYCITATITDAAGNTSVVTADVTVLHDQRK